MSSDRVVAVGLLTRRDLDVWGSGFRRAYPLQDTTEFDALLSRVDACDLTGGKKFAGVREHASASSGGFRSVD